MRSASVRWLIAVVIALAIVGLVAYARNEPGVGGRVPDAPGAAVAVSDVPLPTA